jgi:hypothetical protein
MEDPSVSSFTRTAERIDDRFLIRSTCTKCGASKLVSWPEGSLKDWEANHKCEERGSTGR